MPHGPGKYPPRRAAGRRSVHHDARVFALVAGFVLAAATACTARTVDSGTQRDPAATLRVMTYNIRAGNGDLDRIAAVIRDAAPDVVGLQEVDVHFSARSGFVDQAHTLGRALAMHVRFAHIYELPPEQDGSPPREYGLAMLSRHPVRGFRNHVIPRLSSIEAEPEPRPRPGFLEAVIHVDGHDIRIFNTHLDYRGDPRVRRMQIAAMLDIIGGTTRPTILLGDLNAEPRAPELQPLLARLVDAWTEAGLDPAYGLTFPADTPVKRIDYILLSSHFRVAGTAVLPVRASDHRPLVTELRLDGKGPETRRDDP